MDVKPPKPKKTQYVTIADFEDTVGDGISFSKGQSVEVITPVHYEVKVKGQTTCILDIIIYLPLNILRTFC
jgi:hypothetical protein